MNESLESFLLIALLIFLNASFVAGEFAIARLRKTRIDNIAAGNDEEFNDAGSIKKAKVLEKIITSLNDYISACQVGITISSLALGAVAEAQVEELLNSLFYQYQLPFDIHTLSIFIAIGIITFFHVILGEVVPKNIAIIRPEKVAFTLVYYLRFLHMIFKFPVIFMNACSNLCLKLFNIQSNFTDNTHSEAELKMILSTSQAQGVLEKEEEELMQNVFEFNDTIARDIMIPRSDMFCISANMTIEQAGFATVGSNFSRFLVFQDRIDNMLGYCHIRDIVKAYQESRIHDNIKEIINEVLRVSDGMYIMDLLKLMQEKKKQIAILIDEFGGVTGMVTAEDIVEEIVGEIKDEEEKDIKPMEKLSNGDVLVDGLYNLQELNEELGTNFESEIFDTIGGFVFGIMGTEPKPGDQITVGDYLLKVEKHEKNRIKRLRISSAKKPVLG